MAHQFIKVDDIFVPPNRQRRTKDPNHVAKLMDKIIQHGLIQAPALRTTADGNFVLMAGECRLDAIKMLWRLGFTYRYNGIEVAYGHIPYVCHGELSELEAQEIEFEENVCRQDLTWQDKVRATDNLHRLRAAQKAQVGEIQTIQDTAAEIGERQEDAGDEVDIGKLDRIQDQTRKSIALAQHLDNPAIARAKSIDEGFKILRKQEEKKRFEQLSSVIGATFSVASHKAIQAECLSWMKGEVEGQFDVILTDPPYGIGADQFGDAAGKLTGIDHDYVDTKENWLRLMAEWCPLSYKLCKQLAHAYVFCDIDNFHELKAMMKAAGWGVFRTPLTYYKTDNGRVPLPEHGPRRQTEWVLYAIKGNKPVTGIYPDVIPGQGDDNLGHGAQKPIAVYQNILMRSVRPGDRVLDTFAGSGTIFPAAHSLKVIATGIEMKPEYHGICLQRLQDLAREEGLANLVGG